MVERDFCLSSMLNLARRAQVESTKTAIDPLTNSNAIQNLLALVLWALDSERESSVFLDFPKI
jgi:hypothetical protein